MGNKRPLVFLGLAIGIALVTTYMVYQWLQGQQGTVVEVPEVVVEGVTLAVANNDLPWGTQLAKESFKMVTFPEDSLPVGHFVKPESLTGRVILTNLKKNEAILESKLAPIDLKTGGVSAVMDPNKRAMAVKVNEIVGLPGFVQPGDRVDVMATFDDPLAKGKGNKNMVTKVVLENTLVLATDTQMERAANDEEGPKPVKVITLEVSLEEAEKLAMAENGGKLRLALRSPLNPEVKKTKGANFKDLMASYQLRPPRKKRKASNGVEVINGTKKSTLKF